MRDTTLEQKIESQLYSLGVKNSGEAAECVMEVLKEETAADPIVAQQKRIEELENSVIQTTEGLWFTLYQDCRKSGSIHDMSSTGLFAQHVWDALPKRYRKALPNWWDDHGHVSVPKRLDRKALSSNGGSDNG